MIPLVVSAQRAYSSSSSAASLLPLLDSSAQLAWGCSLQQFHCQQQHTCTPHQPQQQQQHSLLRGFCTTQGPPPAKQLSDIMKLERLQHETADTVEDIWMKAGSYRLTQTHLHGLLRHGC